MNRQPNSFVNFLSSSGDVNIEIVALSGDITMAMFSFADFDRLHEEIQTLRVAMAVERRQRGETLRQIAEAVDWNPSTVHRYLKAHGVEQPKEIAGKDGVGRRSTYRPRRKQKAKVATT